MFEPKIKIHRALYDRLRQVAAHAGYSSVEELVQHILERTAAELETAQSEAEVRERLKGLGYIE
jgi:hypothetical protein